MSEHKRDKIPKMDVPQYKRLIRKYQTLIMFIMFIVPTLISAYALFLAHNANEISVASNDIAKKSNEISNLTYKHTFNSGEVRPIKPSEYFIIRGVNNFLSDYLVLPIEWENIGGTPELIRHPQLILRQETGANYTFEMAGEYADLTNLERPFSLKQSFTIDPHTISQRVLVFHINKWWDINDALFRFRFKVNQFYHVNISYERYPYNQSEVQLFDLRILPDADKLDVNHTKGHWWGEWILPAATAAIAKISNPQFPRADVTILRTLGKKYPVPVTYTITNTGSSQRDFYMGYSTKPSDANATTPTGWYDAPPVKVTLNSGQSATETMVAQLPYNAPGSVGSGYPSGRPYDVTIAVWGERNLDGTLKNEFDRRWINDSFHVID